MVTAGWPRSPKKQLKTTPRADHAKALLAAFDFVRSADRNQGCGVPLGKGFGVPAREFLPGGAVLLSAAKLLYPRGWLVPYPDQWDVTNNNRASLTHSGLMTSSNLLAISLHTLVEISCRQYKRRLR